MKKKATTKKQVTLTTAALPPYHYKQEIHSAFCGLFKNPIALCDREFVMADVSYAECLWHKDLFVQSYILTKFNFSCKIQLIKHVWKCIKDFHLGFNLFHTAGKWNTIRTLEGLSSLITRQERLLGKIQGHRKLIRLVWRLQCDK